MRFLLKLQSSEFRPSIQQVQNGFLPETVVHDVVGHDGRAVLCLLVMLNTNARQTNTASTRAVQVVREHSSLMEAWLKRCRRFENSKRSPESESNTQTRDKSKSEFPVLNTQLKFTLHLIQTNHICNGEDKKRRWGRRHTFGSAGGNFDMAARCLRDTKKSLSSSCVLR